VAANEAPTLNDFAQASVVSPAGAHMLRPGPDAQEELAACGHRGVGASHDRSHFTRTQKPGGCVRSAKLVKLPFAHATSG
jgi:hypothetical protein